MGGTERRGRIERMGGERGGWLGWIKPGETKLRARAERLPHVRLLWDGMRA
jgi:hypothetical protein